MVLPDSTEVIEAEAFAGMKPMAFYLPDSVRRIGDNAFPPGSCVFLNTSYLSGDSFGFLAPGVFFVDNGYRQDGFAASHSEYVSLLN